VSINFNQVPANLRVPWVYIEFNNSQANQGAGGQPYQALIIGQMLPSGTAAPNKPVLVTSANQAAGLFGAGSMLAIMAEAYFENNSFTPAYFLPLQDNPAGTAAKGSVSFSGSPSAAGTLTLYIGGVQVEVGVTAGMTPQQIAQAVVSAINADTTLPVTAAVDSTNNYQVDLTCDWKGDTGNKIDIRTMYYTGDSVPAGLTVNITAMSGGAGNPDLNLAIPNLGPVQYNVIANPYLDQANLTALQTELSNRWGPMEQIEGFAFITDPDSFSNLATFGNGQNSQFFSCMGVYNSPTPPFVWSAAIAGVAAYYAAIDPALPFQTLEISGVLPPALSDRFTSTEQNMLLYDGISTFTVDSDGTVRIQRLISMYQKNAAGAPDSSYLDMCTLFTLSYLRYDMRNYFLQKYPRSKLADDGVTYPPSMAVVTPGLAKAEVIARYKDWMDLGLVDDIDDFKAGLIVERNPGDPNRLDTYLDPNLVSQLMVMGVQIGFLL
jgi:phage tail sheath gpL-like